MKFNFNKKMVSTIVILIFGVAITVAALSAKNIALENKTSSEIATEAVSATEMILDTENTETGNVDKNSSDSSKDKAIVVDDNDKSGDTKNSDESSTTTKKTGKSLKDTKSSSENTSDDVNKTGDKIDKKSEINNSGMNNNNEPKSDNGAIELPIIPID
jgi:lipopolysaccharide export LptBFGC system permease protein LptF